MVDFILRKGLAAFVSKQTKIISAAFFIAATTILAQVLGFLKYRIMLSEFGPSSDLGVFFASFRVPEFLFQVIIIGAVSSSFIPIFSSLLNKNKEKEAFNFASSMLTISLLAFSVVAFVVIIFARELSGIVAPGFTDKELDLMANLTRIVMLSQILFVFATVFTAILQSFQHFLIPGIANALYNVGIILATLFLADRFGIYAPALGALIGSVLYAGAQFPLLLINKYRARFLLSLNYGIKEVIPLMIPRSLTIIVTQLALTANVIFASYISARSIVIFDLAQVLMLAPVLLFGQSIAQASFPVLARKKDDLIAFKDIFVASFNQILYLTLPISALFIVLRIPIVRLLYGARESFDWAATVSTGFTLAAFALSMSAQALIYLLARAFYARHNTRTPFVITLISVVINVTLSYTFIRVMNLPIQYLAVSFTISQWLAFLTMLAALDKKINFPKVDMITSVAKITLASFVMGVSLYIPIKLLDQLVFDTTRTINLLILTGIASGAGLASYLFVTWLLDIRESYAIIAVIKKFKSKARFARQLDEIIDGGSKLNP